MASTEKYLRPDVIRQVARLDLRARFIVEGFLSGLHASPFHGFSVEFSEHRKYVPGDDLKDLDWNVYAKTDKYYLKKFQAETNVTGYLAVHLAAILSTLANLRPTGSTDVAGCLLQLAAMVRTRSLILVFSDLLTDPEPVLRSLHALRHRGHEIIVFHVLDEAEVLFPFEGLV